MTRSRSSSTTCSRARPRRGRFPDQPQELQPPERQVQVFLRHHHHRNKPSLKLKWPFKWMFIRNDFTHMWKYTTIKVVIWHTFPFSSPLLKMSLKVQESWKSIFVLLWGRPSELCVTDCVTRLHFTGGGVMTISDWCRVSRDRGRVTVCGGWS